MSFKDKLGKRLSVAELSTLPASFDMVGSIAIFNKFPRLSKSKQVLVVAAVMDMHPAVQTVAVKVGKVAGRLRVPKLRIIGGMKTKETLHKENGVVLKLD